MKLEKNGFSKRIIVPWYDTVTACWISIFLNALVVGFGGAGIYFARTTGQDSGVVRFACLLTGLGFFVMISTLVRLILRGRSN